MSPCLEREYDMVTFFATPFGRFLILYGALYAGFGVQSAYLPTLLDSRNLAPEAIAVVLATGAAIRLAAVATLRRRRSRSCSPPALQFAWRPGRRAAAWLIGSMLPRRFSLFARPPLH